uniref:G-protein coupled receptors family 1 profile domain-containing protein n=1 Tax=Callorhinchus milii TaxID=7868 RepID=A0A4W3IX40_CALMI
MPNDTSILAPHSPTLARGVCKGKLICFCVTVNVLAMVVLCRGQCGLSRCVTLYLVAMAGSDLLVLITDVILNRISNLNFPLSFLMLTPVCSSRVPLLSACTDASVWLTVSFTLDRFVAICCPSLKLRFRTERSAAIIIGSVASVCLLKNIPWYFTFEPGVVLGNQPYFCICKMSFYNSAAWGRLLAAHRALTPLMPVLLIFLLNSITVRHILVTGRARKRLRAGRSGRGSIVLLFAVSGSFVLLWLTYIIHFLFWPMVSYNANTVGAQDHLYILQEAGVMLQLLSTCTNTAIYGLTQSRFRQQIRDVLTAPCRLLLCLYSSYFLTSVLNVLMITSPSLSPWLMVRIHTLPRVIGFILIVCISFQ